jgi:predicted dehydrogenase
MSEKIGVGIIGCGLIGHKRAEALGPARLVACADVISERAQALARAGGANLATADYRQLLDRHDVEIVIVATTNDSLSSIACSALEAGKHVLVEKPAARGVRELDKIIAAARRSGRLTRVGFNHRYHPAMRKARELYQAGVLGELMFLRGRYGHGGRVGYEKEWRANPGRSGGGELLDQGVHLIDLSRWFLGDFSEVSGFAHTYYWEMPVEDNAFLLLKTPRQEVAFLHVSWTEWKNLFSFEIFGREGKLNIEGLGGSYGLERLAHYKMLRQMGPPQTTIWEYPMRDESWQVEFAEFLQDIQLQRAPSASLEDARGALAIIEKIYAESGYDYHS